MSIRKDTNSTTRIKVITLPLSAINWSSNLGNTPNLMEKASKRATNALRMSPDMRINGGISISLNPPGIIHINYKPVISPRHFIKKLVTLYSLSKYIVIHLKVD